MNISGISNSMYTNNTNSINNNKQAQKPDAISSATIQKPDAISSATKKTGGNHYFEAKA